MLVLRGSPRQYIEVFTQVQQDLFDLFRMEMFASGME